MRQGIPHIANLRDRARLFAKTGGRCGYCGVDLKNMKRWAIEHMAPGGGHEWNNLVPSCVACNSQKKDHNVVEYRAYLRRTLVKQLRHASRNVRRYYPREHELAEAILALAARVNRRWPQFYYEHGVEVVDGVGEARRQDS